MGKEDLTAGKSSQAFEVGYISILEHLRKKEQSRDLITLIIIHLLSWYIESYMYSKNWNLNMQKTTVVKAIESGFTINNKFSSSRLTMWAIF